MNPSDAARVLQAQRKTHGAGDGRPRTVKHNPKAPLKGVNRCLCVECRKARGTYPNTKRTNKLLR